MESIISCLNEALDTATFYGVNNILCLKNQRDVRIVARGYQVKIGGAQAIALRAESAQVWGVLHQEQHPQRGANPQLLHGEEPTEFLQDNLILHGVNGKSIMARSASQQLLVDAYEENDLLFAVGPAGSGKTYTAI